jgi:DNA-binding NarL/FixJ family response regulator
MTNSILIVDDNRTVRECVHQILDQEPDFTVCGEAKDGREAVEMAGDLHPDVVIIDLAMPVMNGLEAAKLIHRYSPDINVILYSNHSALFSDAEARSAGISALVSKSDHISKLIGKTRALAQSAVA